MNDEKVKVDLLYGFASAPPVEMVRIAMPEPRNALEAAWWAAQGIVYDVLVPAFLAALSITAFMWAFRLI